MYRGFITEIGEVEESGGGRIAVVAPAACERLEPGGSVAVAGVCLSAASVERTRFTAAISTETVRRSTLGELPGEHA